MGKWELISQCMEMSTGQCQEVYIEKLNMGKHAILNYPLKTF